MMKKEHVSGKLKETFGKITGNDRQEAEGKTEQAKANVHEQVDKARDYVKGVADGLSSRKRRRDIQHHDQR